MIPSTLCQLTRVPPPDVDPERGGRLAAYRAALLPALTSAHAAGQPVAVAWVRDTEDGPIAFTLGGDLASGPAPPYPPGARAVPVDAAEFRARLRSLPHWVRCVGVADSLTAVPDDERDPPGTLDDLVAHLGGRRFGWLVLAEPIDTAGIRDRQVRVQRVIVRSQDRQSRSGRDRVEFERANERYRELTRALRTGLWRVRVLAGGADLDTLRRCAALLCSASDTATLPYTLRPDAAVGTLGELLGATVSDPDDGEYPFDASGDLLAAIARPPVRELPGIRVVEPPRFDVTPETGTGLSLGVVLDGHERPAGDLRVSTATLNRHAFVAGATGAGKSQTVRHLLAELSTAGVPWLVIEPAKAEYARMAGRLGPTGRVAVIRPGDPDAVAVSLNPLEPEPGFGLQTHLDLVRALFLAAFEATEPFPQVLARALTTCYERAGWDLSLGRPDPARVADGVRPAYPTLSDLQAQAQRVVERVGYGRELAADVRGFIDVRLGSLRLGTPGRFFEGGHPLDIGRLLRDNVVIELEDVGNDQDKAFCIGAILIRLTEHLRTRPVRGPERLRHVTVVEEAHRLLKASAKDTPAAHAVELFASLLAEIRAYGEGVVVAEQIPSKLLPDVVKNSALKVLHRLPAADDRETVGATMNLDERQSRHVVTLPPGEAAVFTDGMDHPVLVRVPLGEDAERADVPTHTAAVARPRGAGCGRMCRVRPCAPREVAEARDPARDPLLVLWIELLVVAHVAGLPRPRPRAGTLSVRGWSTRVARCAVAHITERAIASRYPLLLPWYQPEALTAHVAGEAGALLVDREPTVVLCDPWVEVGWQAGRFRWADVGRALADWDDSRDDPHPLTERWLARGLVLDGDTIDAQLESLHEHPSRSLPGVDLLFGAAEPGRLGALEEAVNELTDPDWPTRERFERATGFLDAEGRAWLLERLLPSGSDTHRGS